MKLPEIGRPSAGSNSLVLNGTGANETYCTHNGFSISLFEGGVSRFRKSGPEGIPHPRGARTREVIRHGPSCLHGSPLRLGEALLTDI